MLFKNVIKTTRLLGINTLGEGTLAQEDPPEVGAEENLGVLALGNWAMEQANIPGILAGKVTLPSSR
jgi:hypothetical protein